MYKKLFFILFFLLICINFIHIVNSVSEDDEAPSTEPVITETDPKAIALNALDFDIHENDFNPDDWEVDLKSRLVKITKSGINKKIDVSFIKDKVTIELPYGGIILSRSLRGVDVDFWDEIIFGKNSKITVENGIIKIINSEIKEGSLLNSESISGFIESYEGHDKKIISMKGKGLTKNGITLSPDNENRITLEEGLFKTSNGDMAVYKDGVYIGKTDSSLFVVYPSRALIIGEDNNPGVFITNKGAKISINSPTFLVYNGDAETVKDLKSPYLDVKEKKRLNYAQVDRSIAVPADTGPTDPVYRHIVEYNGDMNVFLNTNARDMEVTMDDETYSNFIAKQIINFDSSKDEKRPELKLNILSEFSNPQNIEDTRIINTVLKFTDNDVQVQGEVSSIKTNIGILFENVLNDYGQEYDAEYNPWLLYNGELIDKNVIGISSASDIFSNLKNIENKDLKELFIKSLNYNHLILQEYGDSILNSIEENLLNDPENQILAFDQIGEGAVSISRLLELAKDNSDLQNRIFDSHMTDNSFISNDELINMLKSSNDNYVLNEKILRRYFEEGNQYISGKLAQELLNFIDPSQEDYYDLKLSVESRVDGIFDMETFKDANTEKQKEILEKSKFASTSSITSALSNSNDPEIKKIIIDKIRERNIKFSSDELIDLMVSVKNDNELKNTLLDIYGPPRTPRLGTLIGWGQDNRFNPLKIRGAVLELSPNDVARVLERAEPFLKSSNNYPGFEVEEMKDLYKNSEFLEMTKDLSNTERWSVGVSTVRLNKINEAMGNEVRISSSVKEIIDTRKEFENTELLGPSTKNFIIATNDEKYVVDKKEVNRFQEAEITTLGLDSGVDEKAIIKGLNGPNAKNKILDNVKDSKGDTTIYFSGHGGPEHQWLGSGTVGSERSDDLRNSLAISYLELGEKLAQRSENGEKLTNVKIIINSCYSYDFAKNLYSYLGSQNVKEFPIIITATNNQQLAYGRPENNPLDYNGEKIYDHKLYAIKSTKSTGKALTMKDVYKSEGKKEFFTLEDSAVFIPSQYNAKKVNVIGSPGATPSKETTEKIPTFIEIGQTVGKIPNNV